MTDSTRLAGRPRWTWPPVPQTAAAVAASAIVAVLVAGCSGSPSSAGSGGAPDAGRPASPPSTVAFSRCMRAHGVPDYPDPDSGGTLPKTSPQRLGISGAKLQGAERACQHLLPNTESVQQQTQRCMMTGDCPSALVRQITAAELRLARCMRAHGVPDWPDPTIGPEGRPVFDLSAHGIDPHHSPQVSAEIDECERLTGNAPVPMR